jgi:hypothetical protein
MSRSPLARVWIPWIAVLLPVPVGAAQQIAVSTSGPQATAGGLQAVPAPQALARSLEPPPRIALTSPDDGEEGVSLTRETIVYFDAPLDATSAVAPAFSAVSAGQPLPFQARLSADARKVTLFYSPPLPPAQRVRVTVDGSMLTGALGRLVDADGDGVEGGLASFEFDTIAIDPFPGTAVCGRVFASELAMGGGSVNVPLEGVTISVDGAESTLFALTDANGDFRLDPAPAGRFFVHVDGRTATNPVPANAYYPFVGKAWQTRPGEELVLMVPIYLPLVPEETLQPVSQTQDTTIGFAPSVTQDHPELAGTQIVVPAGSLFADDGSPGTMVGIAPVPPDRLPGPLPTGLVFPIVITVQTDGATNFDSPAPARFPNLPVRGGMPLPAGSDASLWSFNHDAGRWEAVAPARVTADGQFVETLAGGILAPGWHGMNPGLAGQGSGGTSCGGSCGVAAATGIFDCATSFIPGAGAVKCGISAVLGGTATARDCAVGLGTGGSGWDCAKSGLSNLGGVGADCLVKSIPWLGSAFSCASAAVSIFDGCNCAFLDPVTAGPDPYQPYLDFLQALESLWIQLYGSSVWTSSLDPTVGDPNAEAAMYEAILLQLGSSTEQGSDGDEMVTSAERNALHLLSLPTGITAADVDALVDYVNLTATFWAQGLFTHAQAGQRGFMDRDQFLAALDQLDAATIAFANAGMDQIDLRQATKDMVQRELDSVAHPDEPVLPPSELLYALVDEGSGLVQRGRIGAGGAFGSLALNRTAFYRATMLDTQTLQVGASAIVPDLFFSEHTVCSSGVGLVLCIPVPVSVLPRVGLFPPEEDTDGDGLSQRAEFVAGTDAALFDTDGDGVSDGAEILQGLDPLGGLAVTTGIIATAPAAATAYDVKAFGDLAAVARGADGVSVYNVFNGMPPILVAQIDTPGDAQAVDLSDGFVVVGDRGGGLIVIDVSDPPNASILHQVAPVDLGGGAFSVATAGGIGFVGTSSGEIVSVDLASGAVLDVVGVAGAVHDLFVDGEWLYALTDGELHSLRVFDFPLQVHGTVAAPGLPSQVTGRRRLFVGDGVAYAVDWTGYDTYDVSDPMMMTALGGGDTAQYGWKQIVLNGTGFGVAAVGPNSNQDPPNDVWLFDVSDPSLPGVFLAAYPTPDVARAVSIFDGLAHVADQDGGLQVVNYLPSDTNGVPPALSMTLVPSQAQYEEGSILLVSASVTDDVQVRNLELLLDGQKVQTDGDFPFHFFLPIPDFLPMGMNTHSIEVRASDTGGNTSTSGQVPFDVVADATPPTVVATNPPASTTVPSDFFEVYGIALSLSERVDPATVSPSSTTLISSGPDLVFGNGDDAVVPFTLGLVANDRRAVVLPSAHVSQGTLRLRLSGGQVADLAGNLLDGDANGLGGDDYVLDIDVSDDVDVFWDGGGDGTSWEDPLNWSGDVLPGPADDVLINSAGTIVVHTSGSTTVQSLTSFEPVHLDGGTLTIASHSRFEGALTVGGTLSLDGGTHTLRSLTLNTPLQGSGDVVVTQLLNLNSGVLQPGGSLTILAGATMTTAGGLAQQRPVVNHGLIRVGSGAGWNVGGTTLTNAIDGRFEYPSGGGLDGGTFDNAGLFVITSGTVSVHLAGWTNTGTVAVDGGALVFSPCCGPANHVNDGLVVVAAGAELQVDGTTFTSNGTVSSAGTVRISGGTSTFNGPFVSTGGFLMQGNNNQVATFAPGQFQHSGAFSMSGGTLTINNAFTPSSFDGIGIGQLFLNADLTLADLSIVSPGRLDGSGDVTITGSMTTNSEIHGSGRLILAPGSTLTATNGTQNRYLENHGAITFNPGVWNMGNTLENAADGTIAGTGPGGLTGGVLLNTGLLTYAGGGTWDVSSTTTNTGTLDVQGGTLRLTHGWTNDGVLSIAAGAVLRTEGNLTLSGTSTVGLELVSTSSLGLLQTTGTTGFDGTLDLTVDVGYAPLVGDAFDVATYGSFANAFGTINGTDLGGGLSLVPSYLASALRLTVQ